jgi:hypothetical protein
VNIVKGKLLGNKRLQGKDRKKSYGKNLRRATNGSSRKTKRVMLQKAWEEKFVEKICM